MQSEVIHVEKKNETLELKKLTLIAWAKVLLSQGMIDIARYEKMAKRIDSLQT